MELGMIGLGKMGANMSERLIKAGHRVIGFDLDPTAVERVIAVGAEGADSLKDLVGRLVSPRVIWMMVPAGNPVDATLEEVLGDLEEGDVVVDGGNSYFRDTLRRAEQCRLSGASLVDVGTSGGVWGLTEGYSLMAGGEPEAVARLRPIFEALAPARDVGWGHVGPSGAGHFVKMVHNGIEYGLMESYAEGFAIMKQKEDFSLDVGQIAAIWRHGSVVRSWLLDLTADALSVNPDMEGVAPWVSDSGEGRWTVFEAIDCDVPAPVITLSLFRRIGSRDDVDYSDRLLAAMRSQFGGHAIKRES